MADLGPLAGFAEVTRTNGICHIQMSNEFFRDDPGRSYPQSIFKVWQASANGSPHDLDAVNMLDLSLEYVA